MSALWTLSSFAADSASADGTNCLLMMAVADRTADGLVTNVVVVVHFEEGDSYWKNDGGVFHCSICRMFLFQEMLKLGISKEAEINFKY